MFVAAQAVIAGLVYSLTHQTNLHPEDIHLTLDCKPKVNHITNFFSLKTTEAYCGVENSCQAGYGSCAIPTPQRCGTGSGTTNGRTVGYYRGTEGTQRTCDVVKPSDIKKSSFTHLNYAFAEFDASYSVVPADTADVPLYTQFTALQSSTLQTWIAIGGGDSASPW